MLKLFFFQVVHPCCVCSTLSSWKYRKVVNTQQKTLLECRYATTVDYMFRPFSIRPSSGLVRLLKSNSPVGCNVHSGLNYGEWKPRSRFDREAGRCIHKYRKLVTNTKYYISFVIWWGLCSHDESSLSRRAGPEPWSSEEMCLQRREARTFGTTALSD